MTTSRAFCLFFSLVTILHAQNPTSEPSATPPPLPPGPLVQARAPNPSKWIIKLAAPSGADKPEGQEGGKKPDVSNSVKVMTKTGPITLRQTLDATGKTWNTWCIGLQQITLFPDSKQWVVQSPSPDPNIPTPNYEDYSKSDFPGFEWISLANYVGLKDISGRKCITFKGMAILDGALKPTPVLAYTDLETRFPVALAAGTSMHVYEFQSPPQVPLVLPTLVQSLVNNQQKQVTAVTRTLPVP